MLAEPSKDLDQIKDEIDTFIYEHFKGVVQSGPFGGMRLTGEKAWKHTRLAPMILGCYEEELHGELERQVNRLKPLEVPKVVVIGCAEGYYAIGLKLRLPNAHVCAVDPDSKATWICHTNAVHNKTEVILNKSIDEYMAAPDLLLVDCEGNEVHYLDQDKFPQLANAHIIVELHDFKADGERPAQNTGQILLERFRGTHRINLYIEGPRDPNRYNVLCAFNSDYRWAAVNEGRPCLMGWYVMTPRGRVL